MLQSGTRLFFPEWSKLKMASLGSVPDKFKLLCVYGTLGLVVTNAPRTAKVLGSNRTGPVVFQTKFSVSKKCCLLFVCRSFVGLVAIS